MLCASAYFAVRQLRFESDAVLTEARVVRVDLHRGSKGGTTFRPTFSFIDESGTVREGSTAFSSTSMNYSVGQMVKVRYRPGSPGVVQPNDFMSRWFLEVLLGFMGATFALMGAVAWRTVPKWAEAPLVPDRDGFAISPAEFERH